MCACKHYSISKSYLRDQGCSYKEESWNSFIWDMTGKKKTVILYWCWTASAWDLKKKLSDTKNIESLNLFCILAEEIFYFPHIFTPYSSHFYSHTDSLFYTSKATASPFLVLSSFLRNFEKIFWDFFSEIQVKSSVLIAPSNIFCLYVISLLSPMPYLGNKVFKENSYF